MVLTAGTRLGSYEVVAPLGAGGMGEVYRARDVRLGRDVAVKVLPDSVAGNPEALARFEREARAVAALSHPNIVTLHDVGTANGTAYAVLELLTGETLRERLASGPLPPRKAVEIGVAIARALSAAHERGIVHRDLKPENLFLTGDGVVKVLDFGLARGARQLEASGSTAPTEADTAPGTVLGTVGYMAPEQVRGRPADHRADVFAFGCVLHEMLTGRRAFRGDSAADVMSAILKEEPEDPPAPLPPALSQIVRHCLEKRPEDRFQSARDLAFALDALSLSTASGVERDAPALPGARRRASWLAPAGVALALAAGAVAGWALHRAPAAVPRPVRFAIPPARGAPYNVSLAFSPDGSQLAFVATGEDGNDRVFLRPLGALEARAVPGTEGASFPFFSPDGRRLGFFTAQALKALDVATLAIQTLCKVKAARGGSWGSSDLILLAPRAGAEIAVVPAGGGEAKKVIGFDAARHESSMRWPMFLPDGRRFIYLSIGVDTLELVLASLDGGPRQVIVKADSPAALAAGHLVYAVGERLLAQPFDWKAGRLTGASRPLAEGVSWDAFASGAYGFALSAGGDLAYLTGGIGKSRLVWYDRSGRRLEAVGPVGAIFEPALSPDASHATISMVDVESAHSQLWLLDLTRGGLARLSDQPMWSVTPLFSHDGRTVAYSTFPSGRVFTRDASGSSPSRPLFDAGIFAVLEHWAADGRLFYTTLDLTSFHMQAFVLPPGGTPQPLLSGPANYQHASLSPDGHWLAYVSDESGREEVLVRSYPEGGQRFALSAEGGTQPQWKGDSRELYYATPDRKLMSVSMPGPGGGEPGRPQVLFQSRILPEIESRNHYAVTRDGQRFLVNERLQEEAAHPVVVELNALR